MKLMVENETLTNRIISSIGDGKIILFRYGPGSGGDRLLRELFLTLPEGVHSVMMSTHETESELHDIFRKMELEPDIISLLPMLEDRTSNIRKKDQFIREGIMVTDLLEISSNSDEPVKKKGAGEVFLSELSTTATRQVLPFWFVLDSINDIIGISTFEDVLHRLMILKSAIREKGGNALIAAPIDSDLLCDHETTFFDGVIETTAEKKGEAWSRKLTIMNVKGKGSLPQEWTINTVKEVPTAISVD
ncbi:MAG: hypothetical protein R6V01_05070 [Thermoplasmatota archaeon]